jgi:hypothetical protein
VVFTALLVSAKFQFVSLFTVCVTPGGSGRRAAVWPKVQNTAPARDGLPWVVWSSEIANEFTRYKQYTVPAGAGLWPVGYACAPSRAVYLDRTREPPSLPFVVLGECLSRRQLWTHTCTRPGACYRPRVYLIINPPRSI